MKSLTPGRISEVVVLGAHCDDIAIGAGGMLLGLCRANPGVRVTAVVLTGGGTEREDEEHAALQAFCPGADLTVTVSALPDGRLPVHWETTKDAIAAARGPVPPDLVLAPQRLDAHQDHRLVAEIAPTVFRDSLILGYEILKWEGDLPTVTVYQPLADELAQAKADLLGQHYRSQAGHDWFDREAFLALLRIRGAQCHTRYAEGFVTEKITVDLTSGSLHPKERV
ncbi:N-acetylglucosaminyl deacetylase, LmbE family [Nakamurella panacisegetis]|uniref:N-acetylglucosaminyl deacetylase, LmbE family n=1 Tax=Nakamurella panacisegetis TaxID=1090615 RepID=A0A1H0LZ69_9ACTN|nr:PIG-L family deacetylase [Nakamurella panacisegetis]SDO73393.1 N-acetylglucosaminyl deacetylase, LmbE family [Nakamurella panacisegetis]